MPEDLPLAEIAECKVSIVSFVSILLDTLYAMHDIYDKESLIQAIDKYIHFYNIKRFHRKDMPVRHL